MNVLTPEQKETIRQAMSFLGSRKSAAKTRSCRLNARKPRKRKKYLTIPDGTPVREADVKAYVRNRKRVKTALGKAV